MPSAGSTFIIKEATVTTFPEHKRLRVITSALVTVFFVIDISARPSSEFSKDKFINSALIVSSLLAIAYARSCNAVPDIMKLSKFKKSKKKGPRRNMECYSVQQI